MTSPAQETPSLLLGITPPSLVLQGEFTLKVMNTSKSPKRARISTGNADAWGASAVTSSPGGGDNTTPLGGVTP